jgi:dienelactone hydrolase
MRSTLSRLVAVATIAATAATGVVVAAGPAAATPAQVAKAAPYAKPGPYAAGVTTLSLDDRKVEVWYPAEKSAVKGKAKDQYYIRDWLPPAIQQLLADANPPFRTNAYRAVPSAKGKFPLIVFEHGFGGYRDQSTFLTTHLAQWGFVVASPDFLERGLAAQLGGAPATPKPGLQVFDETVAVVRRASAAPKGPLSGRVKAGKVGITGHSAGARGTIEVAANRSSQIAGYVPLAGAAAAAERNGVSTPAIVPPPLPNIFIAGQQDGVIPIAGIQSYYEGSVVPPKRAAWIDGSGHLTAFSDICAIGEGGGGIVAIARQAGLPVPENLARLGEDGCKAPALAPKQVWPVTNHFTTALFRSAFRIDKRPVGLNTKAAAAFAPGVTVQYTQTLTPTTK